MAVRQEELVGGIVTARYQRVVAVPNPAAGADWTVVVPGQAQWQVHSVVARLVNVVAVADRLPVLTFDDGSRVFLRLPTDIVFSSGQTADICWNTSGAVYDATATEVREVVPLPQIEIGPGYRVRVITANLQATDQWSGIALYVEETLTGPSPVRIPLAPVEEVP